MKTLLTTLVFLVRDDEVLLAYKKRGFGKDKWNGAGGKVEADETIEQALVRECQEEILITPRVFTQVAIHTFEAVYKNARTSIEVHAFMCTEWEGEPAETEEMRPQWFRAEDIPYDNMWEDDVYWLPLVLEGKKLKGVFTFDENNALLDHTIEHVPSFDPVG